MGAYLIRRTAQAVLTILGVVTVVFFLARLGGDPASLLLPPEASVEEAAALRAGLGLDAPVWVQYGRFISGVAQGDLGRSFRQTAPALQLVLERMPATLELAFASFGIAMLFAFGFGLAAEYIGSRRFQQTLLWLALIRQAIPVFFFGLLLILFFAVKLPWFPALGRGSLRSLVLPALTLGTYQFALYLRLFNSAFNEERPKDYVKTARSKGVHRRILIGRHMLPNALLPIVTIAGINLGALLSGTVITESVFSWPGVGRLIVQSVHQRDYPVIQAGILVVSLTFVVVNLLVDVLYAYIDPRIRLE